MVTKFKTYGGTDWIGFEISSERRLVREVVAEARSFLRKRCVVSTTDVEIVLRELLTNAIDHGNAGMPESDVVCTLIYTDEYVRVRVMDQGQGFDYRSLNMDIPDDPRRLAHRGFVLVKALSTRLEFNEPGNCVTVYVPLERKEVV